jgi:hypothetical protein
VTYTSTATDAAGILFDSAATTKTLRLVSVANDVDGTNIDTGVPFRDQHVLRHPHPDQSVDGSVNFLVNLTDGTQFSIGSSYKLPAGSLRTGVNLYPIVQVDARTTTSVNSWVDFMRMHQYASRGVRTLKGHWRRRPLVVQQLGAPPLFDRAAMAISRHGQDRAGASDHALLPRALGICPKKLCFPSAIRSIRVASFQWAVNSSSA